MAVVAYDTELMAKWTSNLDEKDQYYLDMMNELFDSVNMLVGSPDFAGGIPEHFQEKVLSKRGNFDRYSQTFEDLCKFMKSEIDRREDDTQMLVNAINNNTAF